jgi:hypothetical protein
MFPENEQSLIVAVEYALQMAPPPRDTFLLNTQCATAGDTL